MLVDRADLAIEFDTTIKAVGFWDKIKHRRTGKIYRRAHSLMYDYVPEDHDLLVEVRKPKNGGGLLLRGNRLGGEL